MSKGAGLVQIMVRTRAYGTISSAIFTANLPMLVPPYFCTIHFTEGSIVFWCKFGGVGGPGLELAELEAEDGDITLRRTLPCRRPIDVIIMLCKTKLGVYSKLRLKAMTHCLLD